MGKTNRVAILVITFLSGFFIFSGQVLAKEKIASFKSEINIKASGSVSIIEQIRYDFGTARHHGIYREIPYKYKRNGANYNLYYSVESVTDEKGSKWDYTVSKSGGNLVIKIGNPEEYVRGVKEYIITYHVRKAINFFADHDEFYWNVTGNGWKVPILNSTAVISFPNGVKAGEVNKQCYTGSFGSNQHGCLFKIQDNKLIAFNQKQFSPGQGMSIVVSLPKGVIQAPSLVNKIFWWLADNWMVFLPLLAILIMFIIWYKKGRDPEVSKTIIPIYGPPEKLPAGELGVVADEKADLKDISATLIQLAVKGFLKIKEVKVKKILGKKKDYELVKIKEPASSLKDYEKLIMKYIFNDGNNVLISSLKNNFYVYLPKIKKSLYEQVVIDGYFPNNPEKVRKIYLAVVVLVMAIPFWFFMMMGMFSSVASAAFFGLAAIAAIIFSWSMPRKTKRGAEVYRQIAGFKWFLSVTEKERLKFHNAPEKSPKVFEEFLPYAMVLNVEKQWAEQFRNIYLSPPEWYEGSMGSAFNSLVFVSAMDSLSGNFSSVAVSRPSSAGSGSSGFGGGGFSGGGFGGGGGGSW